MKILAVRKSVYRLARIQHSERWSKQLRSRDYIPEVYLNPKKAAKRNFITSGENYFEKRHYLPITFAVIQQHIHRVANDKH